ncbi:hypothetical protein MN116_007196 [Schistosoma mekongi]|uniref:Major facilitator superfamily (MFS) profile domain-containing protein n=1 Tax=Schistosoma mekongi TaxID=38744 RepID=A0AAE1Z9D4_SCHME|nr:hypothetical protein MN116_007196 [Schistosoma mekongi]
MPPWRLYFTYVSITIGSSFVFGYHTGVINAPLSIIQNFTQNVIDERRYICGSSCLRVIMSICVTGFVIGGLIGGLFGGFLANTFGRKNSLLLLSIPTILGSVLIMVSVNLKSFEAVIFGRFIVGFSAGAYTVVTPTYLSEIAPIKARGVAGIMNQFVTVLAILLSQVLGLSQIMGTDKLWPFLLGLCAPVCLLHVMLMIFCPESPSYLYLIKGDKNAAKDALLFLRGHDYDVYMELDSYQRDPEFNSGTRFGISDLFKIPHLRWGLFIALIPHFGQQLSGINGVLYYSVSLFESVGLSNRDATLVNLGVGAIILFGTIVSVCIIDRGGRRMLLLVGFSVCLVSLVTFTTVLGVRKYMHTSWLTYISILLLYLFVSGFSFGPGSIPWFLVAELFTQEYRDAAASVAVGTNWLCNILVGLLFPQLLAIMDCFAFVPFICVLIIVIVLIALYLPETKGFNPVYIESVFKAQCKHPSLIPVKRF